MRGDTGERTGRRPSGAVVDIVDHARKASTLADVQTLVAEVRANPGVRLAALGPARPRTEEQVAADSADPAEIVVPAGPPGWRLELRVAFRAPDAYADLMPAVREIASAADRALRRRCRALGRLPGPQPPQAYAALADNPQALAFMVDVTGDWTAMSEAFGTVLGYRREAPPEGGLIDLVHPDDRPAAVATFVTACAGQHPSKPFRLRVRHASGEWRTMEIVARSFVTDPQVHAVAYFAVDVTTRIETEQAVLRERERLARVVETLPEGVILIDPDGSVRLVNNACRRLLEIDPATSARDRDAFLGTMGGLLVDALTRLPRLREVLTGSAAVAGAEFELVDGRVLELDFVPVGAGGRPVAALLHLRDATDRVATRRRLDEYGRSPDERDPVLAEATVLSGDFVGTVAHELRGPLSSVVAFSYLLGDSDAQLLNADQRGYLDVIDRNANRALRLIDDLLLLSRLESRALPLRLAPLRLRDLLAAAVTEREPAAGAAGIELRCELCDGPELLGDEERLNQAIANLLGNALTFTPRGGRITVRADCGPQGWTVDVVDTGIGIPPADLPRLFNAFFRGSNVTSALGHTLPGAGLGLVVCRIIAELHGGSIQVASTEGIGTTVTLTLPAATAPGPDAASDAPRRDTAPDTPRRDTAPDAPSRNGRIGTDIGG